MVMGLLSRLLGAFTGGIGLNFILIPLLGIGALVGFHTLVESWKGNLRNEGKAVCNAEWEQRIREEERTNAFGQIATAQEQLNVERANREKLDGELEALKQEYDALRGGSSGSDDGRCLSDGVLERLGRPGSAQGQRGKPSPGS